MITTDFIQPFFAEGPYEKMDFSTIQVCTGFSRKHIKKPQENTHYWLELIETFAQPRSNLFVDSERFYVGLQEIASDFLISFREIKLFWFTKVECAFRDNFWEKDQ